MAVHPVSHPSDRTLGAYIRGELDEASAGSIGAHLAGCSACRRRAAQFSSDEVPGRRRDAGAGPASSAHVISLADGLPGRDEVAAALAPPPVGTLPPGLAGHPDYEVIRELGRGGMGVLYLARSQLMGRLEVLKVVGGDLIVRPGVLERFLREIRSAARLHHPNIVTAYSALRLGHCLALAMEYVEGFDLARIVNESGQLPVADACLYIQQAALGLQHAHEHGMVHRDIKPANLILARGDRPIIKVLDFGLAKVHSEGQGDTSLTREGQMLGTPDFIAPEQIRDAQSADIRADIYSLGCTLYYLLSGGPPFGGDKLWDLYQAHLSMDAAPLNSVRHEVPAELAALVAKMMAKDPGRRFQAPVEVARALTPLIRMGDMGPRPDATAAVPTGAGVARSAAARAPASSARGIAPTPPRLSGPPARPASSPTATERPPAPPPLPGPRNQPTGTRTIPAGLIDLREPKPPSGASSQAPRPSFAREASRRVLRVGGAAIKALSRLGPRTWWSASAVLLLGLAAVWASTRPAPPPGPPMDPSVTNTLGMKFALIPAGTFLMGSPRGDPMASGEAPSHRERIARPFYLGIHEVTRGQFRRFVEETGYTTDAEKDRRGGWGCDEKTRARQQDPRYTWRDPGFRQSDDHPVVNVSWDDAMAFAGWLGRTEGKEYRLPTEVEWEYTCRAGTTSRFSNGEDPKALAAVANIEDATAGEGHPDSRGSTARDGYIFTSPVGRFRPNGLGLFDMHGNVWEWCSNVYSDGDHPLISPEDPPPASSEPAVRAVRGGSWDDEPRRCRSAAFLRHRRFDRSFSIGFRLVLVPAGR